MLGESFTSHYPDPIIGSNPDETGKKRNALGDSSELKLHFFINLQTKGDASTGLYGDNKDATFFKLQQDLQPISAKSDLLMKASDAALKQSQASVSLTA